MMAIEAVDCNILNGNLLPIARVFNIANCWNWLRTNCCWAQYSNIERHYGTSYITPHHSHTDQCSPTPSVSSCLMWRRWEEVSSDLMWQILRWAKPAPHLCGNWCFSGYVTSIHTCGVYMSYVTSKLGVHMHGVSHVSKLVIINW